MSGSGVSRRTPTPSRADEAKTTDDADIIMSETNAAPYTTRRINRFGPALPPRTFAGFAAAVVTVLLIAFFGYRSLDNEAESSALTTHTLEVIQRVDGLLSSLKDA